MMKRNTIGIAALTLAATALGGGSVLAQDDPTAVGGGKKAYVLVIIDSSSSMEWTDDGDNVFPFYDRDPSLETFNDGTAKPPGDGNPDPGHPAGAAFWEPGIPMEIDPAAPAAGPVAFGPCFVWEPDACDKYRRPSWRPPAPSNFEIATSDDKLWWGWDIEGGEFSWTVTSRYNDMRGVYDPVTGILSGYRLQEETQPRHVTIKEVLTGDMVMLPENANLFSASDWDPDKFGPGCWFVPRQRDASVQPEEDQVYCDSNPFNKYVDHATPFPHLQEVYDVQVSNGVLDRLGTTAIFAMTAFDGFRDDQDDEDPPREVKWDGDLNDDIPDGTLGFPDEPPVDDLRDSECNEGQANCDCLDNEDSTYTGPECYDLGIWRVVTPKDLQIPSTFLPELSAYTQIAINDTGFLLEKKEGKAELDPDDKKSKEKAFLGASFPKGFKDYVDKFDLGRQPIARATPLAAAMHDVHQLFMQVNESGHFLAEDTFAECRPKHVMLLTDGKPEPELGEDSLGEAFGYDDGLYPYATTEAEIDSMVNSEKVRPTTILDQDRIDEYRERYAPRVHVVGLNLQKPGDPSTRDTEAIAKLANMAMEGRSCAEFLIPNRISSDDGGSCEPGTGCLVNQDDYIDNYQYEYWDLEAEPPAKETAPCNRFPALILDNNSPEVLSAALFEMFSAAISASGLASRTRLVVSNRLDDGIKQGQYRVYSGTKVGGNSWWKGVVNRTTLECNVTDNVEIPLDEQVGRQVDLSGATAADSRRIFTTVPGSGASGEDDIWNFFDVGTPRDVSTHAMSLPQFFSYDLSKASVDEFQDTYLTDNSTNKALVVGTRVPFEQTTLDALIDPVSTPETYEFFNTSSDSELLEVINTFRARIPERVPGANALDSDMAATPRSAQRRSSHAPSMEF